MGYAQGRNLMQWISDIGSDHNQDIDRIEKLIIAAKEIGCYAAEFQLFRGDNSAALYIKELSKKGE